jgi:hypothetical protein
MGLAEAAKACGVSVSTLRRKRTDLEAHGAAQTATGWHIPVTALIALGLMERVTAPPSHDTPSGTLTGELDALRSQLAAAEQRAAVAEAIAAERERVIQTQAMALRMLEAAKTPALPTPPAPAPMPAEGPLTAPPAPLPIPDTTKDRPSKPVPLLRRLLARSQSLVSSRERI